MTIDTLVQTLRNQAKNKSIILNSDVLPQTELEKLSQAFMLGQGKFLTVSDIEPGQIPDPQAGTLTISAGKISVFKQSIVPRLVFTVDANGAVQCLITAAMNTAWKFTDSFANLNVFPFNKLAVSDACFIYSSTAKDNYSPWSTKPGEKISLAAGLNFGGWLTLDIFKGAIKLLGQILDVRTAYRFSGPFSPDDKKTYPVTTLTQQLGTSSFQITDGLSIGNPALVINISEPTESVQAIELRLAASTDDLEFSVGLNEGDPALTFGAAPIQGHQFTADKILTLPGGAGFKAFIPNELTTAFSQCALQDYSVTLAADRSVSNVTLSIGTVAEFNWSLIQNVLKLENITLDLDFLDPFGPNKFSTISVRASAQIFPSVLPGRFDFNLQLENTGSKWEISTIRGSYFGSVTLGKLVGAIAGDSARVPQVLNDISFSDFGVEVTKQDASYVYTLFGRCNALIPMLDTQLVSTLTVVANYSPTVYDVGLQGIFGIKDQSFSLQLKLNQTTGAQTATGVLSASWKATGTDYLQFEDIASAFSFPSDQIPAIPDGLNLSLKAATLTYDFGKKQLGIGFESATYGNAVFVAMQNAAKSWQFFFGLAIGKSISLAKLPLVEEFLPQDKSLEVNKIQVVLSSNQIDGSFADSINALITTIGTSFPQVPNSDKKGMAAGVNFSLNVDFGSNKFPIVLGTGPATARKQLTASSSALEAAAPASSQGSTKWLTVDKSFGPVSFKRVGVQYQNSKLFFLLDASLSLATLTLGLDGLGVGSSLTSFSPEPHIDGISVSFDSGPVKVDGGLLKMPPPLPPGVTEQYMGQVLIALKEYLITGVGAYAKVNGDPSVFIFAQVKGKFGGPPAFFITGFMGGFGYNSLLTLPSVDQINTFPFVAGLDDPSVFGAKPTPLDVLNVISGKGGKTAWVTPTTGETWIAAGVMFRSFELVLGRVLLVVKFGKEFEVALLGMASMSLPQGSTKANAYAYVELQLEAVFKPDEGFFRIVASLTPNSYLLTKDCRLTGGFAFCLWFGSNPHAGDFVLTVGGYHPAFVVPAWYPKVAPVGFNWAVGGGVTIKGSAYFALTPSAAMAGGSLEVLYQSGALRAWFTAYANLMIRWKPFYFTASIGISIGASYRLNLLFTTVTISVELGATLDLWGPPTGGVVHIHWSIISFSVSFGADPVAPSQMTLDWKDFQSLLPNNNPPRAKLQAAPAALTAPTGSPVLLNVNINSGLAREEANGLWVVRADEFVFTTQSAVPASGIQLGSKSLPMPAGAPAKIDIRPMKLKGVNSTQTVTLVSVDDKRDVDLSTWPAPVTQTANLPEALWGAPLADNSTPAPAASTIRGVPTGIRLAAPSATAGKAIGPVDPTSLINPLGGGYIPLNPGTQRDPIPAPVVDANTITEIMTTLVSPATLQTQQALIGALTKLGAAPPASSPPTKLAQQAGILFSQAPLKAA